MKSQTIYYPKESIKMERKSTFFAVYKNESIEEVFFRAFTQLSYLEKRNYEEKHIENILNTLPRYSLTRQLVIELSDISVERDSISWEVFGKEFERANKQMLLYQFFHQTQEGIEQLVFNFLPVYKSNEGFPLQIGMDKALIDQNITGTMNEEERVKKWEEIEQIRIEESGLPIILTLQLEKEIEKLKMVDDAEYSEEFPIDVNAELIDLEITEIKTKKNKLDKVYQAFEPKAVELQQNLSEVTQSIQLLQEQIKIEEQDITIQKKRMDEAVKQVNYLREQTLAVTEEQESVKERLQLLTNQSEEIVKESQEYYDELKSHSQSQLNKATEVLEEIQGLVQAKKSVDGYRKEYEQILNEVHQREKSIEERIKLVETTTIEKFKAKLLLTRDEKEQLEISQQKKELMIRDLEEKLARAESYLLEDIKVEKEAKRNGEYVKNRKIKIALEEYDALYSKVKYLEHTWRVNQELVVRKEKLTITDSELRYEKEEIIQIKQTAKEVELFVIMDECRTINERVIIRKWPFIRPKAVLLTKDYDALKEKSTYFDLIERENRSLERWFSESVLNKKQVSHKNLTNKIEE
ncbi:coiled-coil domain-containing protein [Carnobacterium maltaromaticum]|uniref:hypothetical protein n=1 Tax=Carnobacterium maltaromaticum TaxID=2751 RepID=UPI001071B38D|nr:hypothetical protein [Carnobacterium maltaromaticum]TFJ77365.1 hypothetical protein CKN94_00930 [Carnobacterium maltaromaticum]TFJ79499.1 hypothetical protein CKN97_00930 [Carnobacterium maltaromaticum]